MESRSTQQAREQFANLVETALSGEHIEITRYGRPLAVIVPPGWYREARKALGMPEEGEQS